MIRNLFMVLVLWGVSASVFAASVNCSEGDCSYPGNLKNDSSEVIKALKNYVPFSRIENDKKLNKRFNIYFFELAAKKHQSPNAVKIAEILATEELTLDIVAMVHHEKVEFQSWLQLGHLFKNVINPTYNNKYYDDVYPIVHRRALIEEMMLIRYYAATKGYPSIPERAYNLVHPLIERWNSSPAGAEGRLRFNMAFLKEKLTRNHLEIAVRVFEEGGFIYKNPNQTIQEAMDYLSDRGNQ